MAQILKIIPYFGKLPAFWPFYINSLAYNKGTLDLLFITDIELGAQLPPNVKVVKSTMNGFFDQAEKALNLKISPEYRNAYKICDYKPAMGKIYQQYLTGYKYWAFGDIDIVYGNLQRYLRYPLEHDYDIISFREDWISGAFTVVKNMPLLNDLCLTSPDFLKVVNTRQCLHFDECGIKYKYLREGYTPEQAFEMAATDITCLTTMLYRLETAGRVRPYYRYRIKESLPFDGRLIYDNGRIWDDGGYTEVAIYHFVSEKRSKSNFVPRWKVIPDKYYLAATGIYSESEYKFYGIISWFRRLYGTIMAFKKRADDSFKYRTGKWLGKS